MCEQVTLTDSEKAALQAYCAGRIQRDPTRRPPQNELLDGVAYYWQEALRPAPESVKRDALAHLSASILAWRKS